MEEIALCPTYSLPGPFPMRAHMRKKSHLNLPYWYIVGWNTNNALWFKTVRINISDVECYYYDMQFERITQILAHISNKNRSRMEDHIQHIYRSNYRLGP